MAGVLKRQGIDVMSEHSLKKTPCEGLRDRSAIKALIALGEDLVHFSKPMPGASQYLQLQLWGIYFFDFGIQLHSCLCVCIHECICVCTCTRMHTYTYKHVKNRRHV